MWELVNRFSHGRYPVRRILLLAITGLMTFLVASLTLNTPVYADDATRSGDTVTYQDNAYTKITNPSKELPLPLQSETPRPTGYRYVDESAKKAHFIFTVGDPAKATTGNYVVYDYTPEANYSNPSPPTDITFVAGSEDPGAEGDTPSCDSATFGSTGWLVCPVVGILATGMDKIYEIVSDFLVIRTVTNDTNSPLYRMWMLIRDIANICFVIAILIIVYSQLTSIGISNYGIKKLLPRLIIGAILVNVSFWLCAIAVDASNILGYGIHNLFVGIRAQFMEGSAFPTETPTWQSIAGVILAGSGTAVGGWSILVATVGGSAYLFIPTLLGAILAIIVALLVLAARQALITVFIIIAPLAFVAYLLPNTEKWFTKWREAFTTLLLLFPIFSVIFSGAQLAGMAIIQTSGGNLFIIILGLGVQVAPVVITPMIVKFGGGLIGKIAGIVNNPNKGLVDRTRKWAEGAAQEHKNKVLTDQTRLAKSKRFGYLARNPISAASKGINKHQRYVEGRRKALETKADNWFDDTNRGRQVKTMTRDAANDKKDIENRYMRSDEGRRTEIRSRHLDIDKTETENDLMRSNAGKYITYRQGAAEVDKTRVHNEFEESSFGHKLDTAKRNVERQKKIIEASHEQAWHFRNLSDAGSQEQEMRLRIAADQAARDKNRVDTMYNELKIGEGQALTKVDASVAANLAKDAYTIAEQTRLIAMRDTGAASELKAKINESLLTNGAVYQVDASGDKVIVNGKPVVVDNRTIDGRSLQEYATGFGKREEMLANAVAEKRSDWGKQAQAAGELIEHFKLNSKQAQDLALNGKGTVVVASDDSGNQFTFDAGDEYVKEAAIIKQFKEGSASQKETILNETGKEVTIYDADGNAIGTRQGHNYAHRITVKNEAIKSSIAGLLPFINDITYDEIGKGNYSGEQSKMMHSLRQIFDGRIKSNNLVGASDAALKSLVRAGELVDSQSAADRAEYQQYKSMVLDLYQKIYTENNIPPERYQELVDSFDNQVRDNFASTMGNFKQILENTTLGASTSLVSKAVMKKTLSDHGIQWKDR